MAISVFDGRTTQPTSTELEVTLGAAAGLLRNIEQHLAERHGEVCREWNFYGKKAGWTLAVVHGKRRVFHLIPQEGRFTIVFTLGERAVRVASESELPSEIKAALASAKPYAEGRSIRLDVCSAEDVSVVEKLILAKMSS